MRRFFRRKKKLIIRVLLILIVLILVFLLIRYILPKAGIDTFNFNDNEEEESTSDVGVTLITEPTVTVSLPEYITTVDEDIDENLLNSEVISASDELVTETTGANGKTYTSYVDNDSKYLITILSDDHTSLTITLSSKASSLISSSSKAEVGVEYTVSDISEYIVGVYSFTYADYEYPILLLLSSSGSLYYVDLESSIATGEFKAQGPIQDIPQIGLICPVIVSDGNTTYKSAVLTSSDATSNGVGYEFTLDMIGK